MNRPGLLLVLPLLAASACGGSGATAAVKVHGTVAAAGAPAAQTAEVDGRDTLIFAPNVVTARVGVLSLTLSNTGQVPHNLEFDDTALGAIGSVGGGLRKTLRIRFDKAGTYTFQCTFHPGMTGKVVVS